MTASKLNPRQTYEIVSLSVTPLLVRMMEMGILPGKKIRLFKKAPFDGPMAFLIDGNIIALRIEEADLIQIKEA